MAETPLKAKLVKRLRDTRPDFVVIRHEGDSRHGVPDISATGLGFTSWWEVKHADPTFDSEGVQELSMKRLAAGGYARYIIFDERDDIKSTWVLTPEQFAAWPHQMGGLMRDGFDYDWVVQELIAVHRLKGRV